MTLIIIYAAFLSTGFFWGAYWKKRHIGANYRLIKRGTPQSEFN